MAAFYNLRKSLGLANVRHRISTHLHLPTLEELAAAREVAGEVVGFRNQDGGELARRIAAAYAINSAEFAGYGDSMWEGINRLSRPVHDLLLNGTTEELSFALDHPHTTNLFLGFDNPVAAPYGYEEGQNLLSIEISDDMVDRIYLSVRRLAEAVGATKVANPETLSGTTETIEVYLSAIDDVLGFELDFPNFYPHERGVRTSRGIISYRPLQAIYQAYRLKSLGATKVLEIGAGLGRTAYYAHRFGIRDYTIVDIPLSNVAQSHFLSRALGTEQVSFAGEDRREVRIVGPSFVPKCSEHFDVVLNVDSLSEMDLQIATDYVTFARRSATALVSINREWDDQARVADMVKGLRVLRFPYWMREGYVEEIVRF